MIRICNHGEFEEYLQEKMQNKEDYQDWLNKMSAGQRKVFDNWLLEKQ